MAITAWKTYTSGAILTAADLNTYQRDNGRWLSHHSTGGAPMARVYMNGGTQGLTSGTNTPIGFDTARFDPDSMFSNIPSPARLTLPSGAGGKYLVGAHLKWQDIASPSGFRHVELRQIVGTDELIARQRVPAVTTASTHTYQSLTTLWDLAAADEMTVNGWHNQGANLNVVGSSTGDETTELWLIWVGE